MQILKMKPSCYRVYMVINEAEAFTGFFTNSANLISSSPVPIRDVGCVASPRTPTASEWSEDGVDHIIRHVLHIIVPREDEGSPQNLTEIKVPHAIEDRAHAGINSPNVLRTAARGSRERWQIRRNGNGKALVVC